MADKYTVRDKIFEYYYQVLRKRPQKFTNDPNSDAFVKQNPLAFLFAVIMDQGAVAERIWAIPYHLKNIMGHLDARKIALMSDSDIYNAFEKLPSKPRFPKVAAKRIRDAAIMVIEKYQGSAINIWNDSPKAGTLQDRFDQFDGISQKKASMATRILGMDLNVPINNWNEMDVSVDEMIIRVFPRTGLSTTNNPQDIIQSARQLNPSFPGAFDYPCWEIGRTWCDPQKSKCDICYIGNVCPKL